MMLHFRRPLLLIKILAIFIFLNMANFLLIDFFTVSMLLSSIISAMCYQNNTKLLVTKIAKPTNTVVGAGFRYVFKNSKY